MVSIQVTQNTGISSKVKLQYYINGTHTGLEIMGKGASLSQEKGKSLRAVEVKQIEEGWKIYEAELYVENKCEFLGRSYLDETDFYEEGEPFIIIRKPSGNIEVKGDPQLLETVQIKSSLPIEWAPTAEDAEFRLRKAGSEGNFTQYIVDSIIYVFNWLDKPKVLFLMIHKLMKNIRDGLQTLSSQCVSQQIQPLLKIYFEILMEIRSSDETQDPRIIPGTFEKRNYADRLMEILDKVTENMVLNPDLELKDDEKQKDEYLRLRTLLELL